MPVSGASLRRLTIEAEASQQTVILSTDTSTSSGYVEAFDILDGIARQLSGDAVDYPTKQSPIVRDIEVVPTSVA